MLYKEYICVLLFMNVFSWLTDTFCSVHEMVFASTRLFENSLCYLEYLKMLCLHSYSYV